jgi:hypothetical protein
VQPVYGIRKRFFKIIIIISSSSQVTELQKKNYPQHEEKTRWSDRSFQLRAA